MYKGVVPECVDWIEELVSGKVVALRLTHSTYMGCDAHCDKECVLGQLRPRAVKHARRG